MDSRNWMLDVASNSPISQVIETVPMTDVEFSVTPEAWHISISDSESESKDTIIPEPSARDGVIILPIKDFDFVTMHNILYFLYTGCVNLHFGNVKEQDLPGYPDKADPFSLFCAADFYDIKTLQERCFRFLMDTRTPDNICSRLFNQACKVYQYTELREKYITFLLEHYDEVKAKEDWEMVFSTYGAVMADEYGKLIFEIMGHLNFHKPE